MINRILPRPILSLILAVVWIMLSDAISWGSVILGTLLGIVIPLLTRRLWDTRPEVKKPLLLLRYTIRVLVDILIANLQVAWLIARPWKRPRPAFVEYRLKLRRDFSITLLASTISLTPGTISANLRLDKRTLLIHVLDVTDIDALIEDIYQRYERPLLEIYE
ncbi:Na+/H+ antiporter subunit E [Kushneria aurantia]|uniref:Na+/H+ antiporter subunit E n=1 Tax=Kushneria aurantia TaxID=504092 RepID=A0ABV6G6X1_9GAMM|nr:Na+/H+ antiporter subunit E [Kushneria aurantia]